MAQDELRLGIVGYGSIYSRTEYVLQRRIVPGKPLVPPACSAKDSLEQIVKNILQISGVVALPPELSDKIDKCCQAYRSLLDAEVMAYKNLDRDS